MMAEVDDPTTRTARSYREQFRSDAAAATYDAREYAPDSYASVLWDLEREILDSVLIGLPVPPSGKIAYLDFACGTGRVLAHLQDRVDQAVGVEISPAMAERARARTHGAEIRCEDLTVERERPAERFDLITAFRFVLNADDDLRAAALAALATRLRDGESRLVVNNHGNLMSVKVLGWPAFARRRRRGRQTSGNLLAHRHLARLFDEAGLRVVERRGMGLLSGRLGRRLGAERTRRLERAAARSVLGQRLAVNQVYVLARA